MKEEILTCDICKKSARTVEEKKELDLGGVDVGFTVQSYPTLGYRRVYAPSQEWSKDICIACRRKLGLVQAEIKKRPPEEPLPPIEQVLRGIMQDEIEKLGLMMTGTPLEQISIGITANE